MFGKIAFVGVLTLLLGISLGSQAQAGSFEQEIAGGLGDLGRDRFPAGNPDGFTSFMGTLLGKGGPGSAQIRVEIEPAPPVAPTGVCPAGFVQFPVPLANFVSTFNDLSLLSGGQPEGSFSCLDLQTGNLFLDARGVITGGNGRFEGATGTWRTTAVAEPAGFVNPLNPASFRVTGTTVIDLD